LPTKLGQGTPGPNRLVSFFKPPGLKGAKPPPCARRITRWGGFHFVLKVEEGFTRLPYACSASNLVIRLIDVSQLFRGLYSPDSVVEKEKKRGFEASL